MRLLWLARFEVPADGLLRTIEVVVKWLRSPRREPDFPGAVQPGDYPLQSGGHLQVDQSPEGGVPDKWAMRYERPVPEQGLVWVTEFGLERTEGGFVGVGRLHQRSLGVGRPRFDRIVCHPPGFVYALRDRGLLGEGSFRVHTVTPETVQTFARDVISPHRQWPLLAVSVEPYTEQPLFPTTGLQDELIGVAEVVELTKAASLSLPREFEKLGVPRGSGRTWGVYGGAVKVYRTQARIDQTPFDHPIWLPADVSAPDFPGTLKEWCWSLSALEAPHVSVDVATIRSARMAPSTRSSEKGLTQKEEIEFLQMCIQEEEKNSSKWKSKFEDESERSAELAEIVRSLESKNQALQFQLSRKHEAGSRQQDGIGTVDEISSPEEAVMRAREEFGATLLIPANVAIETDLDGPALYSALLALHRLCQLERRGQATHKREQLRDLLGDHVGVPKDTYKCGDTGVVVVNPETGESVGLRERVHLKEGKPSETESIYWQTIGSSQESYRYLIGRIGRHA
jgi:hypothetical protein